MVGALDRNEDRNAEPDLVLIDQRDPAQDHAVGLEPLDALPAGGRGQADPVADLGDGEGGVLLQHGQDFAVDRIEAAAGVGKLNGEVGHEKKVPYCEVSYLIYRKIF